MFNIIDHSNINETRHLKFILIMENGKQNEKMKIDYQPIDDMMSYISWNKQQIIIVIVTVTAKIRQRKFYSLCIPLCG